MEALRAWLCPNGHFFQARDDDGVPPVVWWPTCKRCPIVTDQSRPLMSLVEVTAVDTLSEPA